MITTSLKSYSNEEHIIQIGTFFFLFLRQFPLSWVFLFLLDPIYTHPPPPFSLPTQREREREREKEFILHDISDNTSDTITNGLKKEYNEKKKNLGVQLNPFLITEQKDNPTQMLCVLLLFYQYQTK